MQTPEIPKTTRLHIDASRLRSGGGVVHLTKLLEYADYSDFDEIIVHTYKGSEFHKFASNPKVKIQTHPYINRNIFFQIVWQMLILKRSISPSDFLFSIDSTSFCFVERCIVLNQDIIGFQPDSYAGLSLKSKIISYLKYLVAKRALQRSILNIYTTHFAKDVIEKKIGGFLKSRVIPHGVDEKLQLKKENYNLSDDVLEVIYVSPVLGYKNHYQLIEAISNLPTERRVKAYFVGGGEQHLIDRLKSFCVKDSKNEFHFLGFLDREEVSGLTVNCDMAFFMSSVECFGITLLEYMKSGMPIICSDRSSMFETLEDGGILVDPFCKENIIQAIQRLESDMSIREQFGQRAIDISSKYSWQRTSRLTHELLNELIASP